MKPATSFFLAALAAPIAIQAAFTWKNVHIGGGGGFVPSIIFHPKSKGLAYARTDLGGLYRLNSDDSWTPVTDANNFADDENWRRWGIDAVALDPQDSAKVFAAVGMYTNSWDTKNGQIARSYDQGATWHFSDLPFKVGGNMPTRGTGERLAFDPKNNNIVYFAARSGNGLWKSTDGGVTWNKVDSFHGVGTYRAGPPDDLYNGDIQGMTFVAFDETSSKLNGLTSRIFVGTADKDKSVYVSNDAGATWNPVAGQPQLGHFPHKGRVQTAEKALYLSYSNGTGPYDGGDGGVWRYDITAGTWKDISPVNGSDLYFGYGGLSVDAQKAGTLIVASLNSWWPDAQLFRSTDSGMTWKRIWHWENYPGKVLNYTQSAAKAPWIKTSFLDVDEKDLGWMIEGLEIDPFDSNHWLYGTGMTIYGGHDLTNWDKGVNVTIESLADGIEEMAIQGLASAPSGSELLVATYDNNGFTFKTQSDLSKPPQKTWMDPKWSSSVSVDYAGKSVANVVRVGNTDGKQMLAVSSDGGVSWKVHAAADTSLSGGTVALSADASTVLWSTAKLGVQRSQNGAAFTRISGLAAGAHIASDKQDPNVFYAGAQKSFYKSTDTGNTFSSSGSFLNATVIRHIVAHPAEAGHVFVSTDLGIFRSTNAGGSFSLLSTTVTNTSQIALGKGSSSSSWNLYAAGNGPQGRRVYGSPDLGATWVDLQAQQSFGAVDGLVLAGSGNVANLVYVGTNGRGVFSASGGLLPPPATETIPQSNAAAPPSKPPATETVPHSNPAAPSKPAATENVPHSNPAAPPSKPAATETVPHSNGPAATAEA